MRFAEIKTHTSEDGYRRRSQMLKWAAIFFIIALIAGALGFMGVAGAAASIAKFLFGLFLVIAVLMLVFGIFIGKKLF